jgi:tetratricopeptide (TPR) repeat protein
MGGGRASRDGAELLIGARLRVDKPPHIHRRTSGWPGGLRCAIVRSWVRAGLSGVGMARVYVSSTIVDLKRERQAVIAWLVAAQHQVVHSYRPNSDTVRDSCLADVDTCDLYVLILGHRYGFQPADDNPAGLSITHLEFRRAGDSGIPRVALLRTSIPDVTLSDLADPQKAALVFAFRDEVARKVRPAEFEDEGGLITGLSTGVPAELTKRPDPDRSAGRLLRLTPRPVVLAGREELLAEAVPAHMAAWRVPLRNAHFVGRERELVQIRSTLINTPTLIVQSLRGLGGIGKTQLAVEYAHRFASHYDIVWWVDAEDPSTFPIQLGTLAVELGIASIAESNIALEFVKAELRRRTRWLMIFDNAEDMDKVRRALPSGSGHVLITTRRSGFGSFGPVLDLNTLKRSEALELLRRRVASIDDSAADELAEELGDLPLALAQAAAYMEETSTPPDTYLTLLSSHSDEMRRRGRVNDSPFNLESVWSLSIQSLRSVSPAAVDLLSLCSWMAPDEIPLDLFTENASTLPDSLSQLMAADSVAWNDCVGHLTTFSLARRTRRGLIFHRLTQAVGRSLSQHSAWHPLVTATGLLARDVQVHDGGYDRSIEAWARWRVVLPHVLFVIDQGLRDTQIPRAQIASLMHRAGIYLQTDPERAESLLKGALRFYEEIYPSGHPAIGNVLTDLGWLFEDRGQWDAACEILRRARKIQLANYGPDDPRVAAIDTHLASCLRGLGRASEALSLLHHALSVHEVKSGHSHPATATTLNILAMTYQSIGQPRRAKPFLQRAVTIRGEVFGEDHPMTATHVANLSLVMAELQEFTEARKLADRALATRQRYFGPASYPVGRSLHQLGRICLAMGDLEAATTILERSLEVYESVDYPVPYIAEVRNLLEEAANRR